MTDRLHAETTGSWPAPGKTTRLSLSGPPELVSVIPHLLGFTPVDCLVSVHLDATGRVVATSHVDLSGYDEADRDTLAEAVAGMATRTGAPGLLLVVCRSRGDDPHLPLAATATAVNLAAHDAGLRVHAVLLWDGPTAWPYGSPEDPWPIDAASPACVRAIVEGSLPSAHGTRADRVRALAPEPTRYPQARALAAADAAAARRTSAENAALAVEMLPVLRGNTHAVVTLAAAMSSSVLVRDYVLWHVVTDLGPVGQDGPRSQLSAQVLDDLVWAARGTPDSHRAPLATVAALACYLVRGEGLSAGALLRDALTCDPLYTLAQMGVTAVTSGIPPDQLAASTIAALTPEQILSDRGDPVEAHGAPPHTGTDQPQEDA